MTNHPGKKEHQEQAALFEWRQWMLNQGKLTELALLHAIPLQRASKNERIKMANEGAMAGVPDIHLPVARGDYHSLYIEMKLPGKKPTKEQRWWIENLALMGNRVEICYSSEEAQNLLIEYLTPIVREEKT